MPIILRKQISGKKHNRFSEIARILLSAALLFSAMAAASEDGTFSIYRTLDGETLEDLSSRIYQAAAKWTLIYYFNKKILNESGVLPQDIPAYPMPSDIILGLLLPEQAQIRYHRKKETALWAIRVMSCPSKDFANSCAVNLIDRGYFAYLKEEVYEKSRWNDVYVGFFRSQELAESRMKKIADEFQVPEEGAIPISETDAEALAGYYLESYR